jgi:hypothetical protein
MKTENEKTENVKTENVKIEPWRFAMRGALTKAEERLEEQRDKEEEGARILAPFIALAEWVNTLWQGTRAYGSTETFVTVEYSEWYMQTVTGVDFAGLLVTADVAQETVVCEHKNGVCIGGPTPEFLAVGFEDCMEKVLDRVRARMQDDIRYKQLLAKIREEVGKDTEKANEE